MGFVVRRFVDARRGWIVGSQGHVLFTKDGGRSWEQQRPPQSLKHNPGDWSDVAVRSQHTLDMTTHCLRASQTSYRSMGWLVQSPSVWICPFSPCDFDDESPAEPEASHTGTQVPGPKESGFSFHAIRVSGAFVGAAPSSLLPQTRIYAPLALISVAAVCLVASATAPPPPASATQAATSPRGRGVRGELCPL